MTPGKRLAPWLACALLALMGVLAGGAALRESVTYDEVVNVGAGVSYWQTLDLRLSEEHPPLARLIAAIPLVVSGVRADYTDIAWRVSDRLLPSYAGQLYFGELVLKHWNDPRRTLALARLPMLMLTLLLGCLVYFYAQTLGGPWGGVLCTAVYASSPLFLGHGPFVLTDVPVAAFVVLTLFAGASFWHGPAWRSAVVFGLSLGGALLVKFSALVLLPVLAVFAVSMRPGGRRLKLGLAGVGIAVVAVYGFYLVFSWNESDAVLRDLRGGPALRRILMPPWLYLRGLFLLALSSSRPAYLLGRRYPQGVWFYFPVLLVLKSAVGFLALLVTGAALGLARGIARRVRAIPDAARAHWRVLWIALVMFSALCLLSKLDIGFRHFSAPVVLLILMLAPVPRMIAGSRALRVLVLVCAVQCLATAVWAYPFYLTYANVLGSFRPHYELFNDSNLDWDQSLPEVERFVEQHGIRSIGLDHYGYTDAAASVPGSYIWNCERPAAADGGKWVAVSANLIADVRDCRWLLRYPFEVLGGGSMYVVRLPEAIPARDGVAAGFMVTSQGGDARQRFVDFARDPGMVASTAAEADGVLRVWVAELLKGYRWLEPRWLERRVDGWLDGR